MIVVFSYLSLNNRLYDFFGYPLPDCDPWDIILDPLRKHDRVRSFMAITCCWQFLCSKFESYRQLHAQYFENLRVPLSQHRLW